jgi:hypothetical protein
MAKQPAQAKKHSWAGWIPTVSGQLSFSIIGHSSAARNCAYVNEVLPGAYRETPIRYIALHQQRCAPDFPYPDFVTRWLYPGFRYDFFLTAQTAEAEIQVNLPRSADGEPRVKAVHNAQGVLKGRVQVLLHEKDKTLRQLNIGFIDRFKARVWQANGDNIAKTAKVIAAQLSKRNRPAFLEADFELYRSGEFRLEIDERSWRKVIGRDDLEGALKVIPNQIFYFVKDVVHRHYHHDGSSDQMLSLTRLDKAPTQSEIDWRRHTLWGLVRVVMQYRRAGFWPDLQKAKGVTAYAEAFQQSFANCIRMPFGPVRFKATSELSTYDFKHIRDSIEVSIAENTARRTAIWQGATLGVSLALSVMLAWSSYGSKLLSMRLSSCSPAMDSNFWRSLRGRLSCEDGMATATTGWETLAASHPVWIIGGLLVLVAIMTEHYLLDVAIGRTWFGRRWQSIRSTMLLFVYAFDAWLISRRRIRVTLPYWASSSVTPGLLGVLMLLELLVLKELLRQL